MLISAPIVSLMKPSLTWKCNLVLHGTHGKYFFTINWTNLHKQTCFTMLVLQCRMHPQCCFTINMQTYIALVIRLVVVITIISMSQHIKNSHQTVFAISVLINWDCLLKKTMSTSILNPTTFSFLASLPPNWFPNGSPGFRSADLSHTNRWPGMPIQPVSLAGQRVGAHVYLRLMT